MTKLKAAARETSCELGGPYFTSFVITRTNLYRLRFKGKHSSFKFQQNRGV